MDYDRQSIIFNTGDGYDYYFNCKDDVNAISLDYKNKGVSSFRVVPGLADPSGISIYHVENG